ncbi:uncharacterized protein LOC118186092, partial [Stegodyphus dumicola]|uniref:uncharacterized protein LOC118186092 n=1 Tax=Stegodyphus dumicola TaxID=202533 RepID=UPI0015AC1DCF
MQNAKEHDDSSDRKFRKTLNVTIINNFLDLEKLSSHTSGCSTLSAFFHHVRNSFKEIPHIFVTNLSYSGDEAQKVEDHLSSSFTEWLMMWILRVLSQQCASLVHQECEELFLSLIHLIKIHNVSTFRHYIFKLMELLT